jgi:heterodisulfide reductase subunit A
MKKQPGESNGILIVGAGIAGASVAERLQQEGKHVYLIEKKQLIGGHVAEMGCKATDVCLKCNVCSATEILRTVSCSPGIDIYTNTELVKLRTGENGSRYTATLQHQPSFIACNKCTGCQACIKACPEKCIYIPDNSISPALPVIDYSLCRKSNDKECSECEQACQFEAININEKASQTELDINQVVIATGYEPYNPLENASYGYRSGHSNITNVISGMEAEHQLAKQQKITRPSDGLVPESVAFIQCVGSRSEEVYRRPEDTNYCSSVCCAYALRMARRILFENKESKITVFYMDIQNFGRGFNDFFNQCKSSFEFIRSRPYEIKQGENNKVRVKYTPPSIDKAQVVEQEFDLVILSIGMRPGFDTEKLAEKLLIPLDRYGFFGFKNAGPLPELQREGIFVAGACESPKDIESSIAQAEAVCSAILNSG